MRHGENNSVRAALRPLYGAVEGLAMSAGLAAAALLAVTGCGASTSEGDRPGSDRAARVDRVALPTTTGDVGRPHIAGAALREAPSAYDSTLEQRIFAPLVGDLSPTAARSPDGRWLLYGTWRDHPGVDYGRLRVGDFVGEPSLRLRDERTGDERVYARGADSFAWRRDGALAYVQALEAEYRSGEEYSGHLYVRASPFAAPERWTAEAGRYVVVAWAGERLIAYQQRVDESPGVLVFDRPGASRVLARDALVVAVEPAGGRLLLGRGEQMAVELVDIASGRTLGSLQLDGDGPGPVAYGGDWTGDHVVAPGDARLVVFGVSDGLSLEQVIDFGSKAFEAGGLGAVWFLDDAGTRVAAVASVVEPLTLEQVEAGMEEVDAPGSTSLLVCDRRTLECRRSGRFSPRTWIELIESGGERKPR